ncbi:hypothetical protein [Rhodocista pekingensis]|uniref:Uncharacterized protein n=1 Tax=Rhodocista pekingensis TaxID=201185 RepID=A0ABW2KZP5_9PROT
MTGGRTGGPALSARDWAGKAAAGLVLGFLLALGASGLLRTLLNAGEPFFSAKGQFSMWMMAPVWALVLSFCFLFRSGLRAWMWLLLANIPVWGLTAWLGGLRL